MSMTTPGVRVMTNVRVASAAFAAGDEDAILDCFHDVFSSWRYGDTVPRNKHSIRKFLSVDLEGCMSGERMASYLL